MISIITVCHNSTHLLPQYVGSFLKHHMSDAAKASIEFVLVENSGDMRTGSFAAELQSNGFNARVIDADNRGFGAGCNLGVKFARGNFLVFANPDIQFISDLTAIESCFDCASWGTGQQINSAQKSYSFDLLPEYRSLLTELARVHRYLHLFPSLYRLCYPVGAFMIVPRTQFEATGGFDERFFLYYEEVELSRRLHARLGSPKYCPGIAILHDGFGTQSSRDFTFREESKSLVKYAQVTEQPHLAKRRLRTLRLLSAVSRTAAARVPFLREAISSAEQQEE